MVGKKISDNLDYSIESIEERLELVNKLVGGYNDGENGTFDKYLTDYYSNNYNPHVNQNGFLSENTKVGKDLETIASYLLYTKDSEANEDTITDYKKKRNNIREASIENVLKVSESKKSEKKPIAKNAKIKVTKQDRKEYEDLRATGEAVSTISKMIKTKKDTKGNPLPEKEIRKLKWIRTDIQKDEIAMKNELKGYIRFQSITKVEKDMNALSYIRYDDLETIRILIENYEDFRILSQYDTHGYLKIILFDLDRLIAQTNFDDYMKDVLIWKIQNIQYDDIMKMLKDKYDMKITKPKLSELTRKTLPSMIVETYKQQKEDWVYTYVYKGNYKTCSSCKVNYLAIKKYFSPDNHSKTGFRPVCRKCRKKKYYKK